MSFAVGMCLLMIVSSLVREDDLPEASAEKGTQDMQTSAAEGTPAAKPRSITISHTPGQGITLHIDEGMRAAIADSVERDVKFFTNYAADVVKALAESKDAPLVKQAIMDAVRTVVMGAASDQGTAYTTADVLKHYEGLLRHEQELLALAEAALQGPEELRPRPEDVAVRRAEVAHLEAKIAQVKADQIEELTAASAAADERAVDRGNDATPGEPSTRAQQIHEIEDALTGLRQHLAKAEASWNAPESERVSYEQINSLREQIKLGEELLASLKEPDASPQPAAPAAELPTEMTSAQPA